MGKQISKQKTQPNKDLELAKEDGDSSSGEWTYGSESESDDGTEESKYENDDGQPKHRYHEIAFT